MLEKQRHEYLSIFDVDQYVPTKCLIGAKPSVKLPDDLMISCEVAVAIEGQKETSDTREMDKNYSQSTVVDHDSSLEDFYQRKKSETLKVDKLSSKHLGIEKPNSTSTLPEPINFVLSAWRVNEDCLVLDSRKPGTALPTDHLLQNILRAIGYSLAQLPASEALRWPLFRDDHNARDPSQARAMVQAFVYAQYSKKPFKILMLMGQAASQFALDGKQIADNTFDDLCEAVLQHSEWPVDVAIIPSLYDMLQEPMLKATAWKTLQQFLKTSDR